MNHRISGGTGRTPALLAAAAGMLISVLLAVPAAAQTINIQPAPVEAGSTVRAEEGGWAGFYFGVSGGAPTGEVTVTCELVLRAESDPQGARKTHFRANALATSPLSDSDPLPTDTLTFGPSNWPTGRSTNAQPRCALWTFDDLEAQVAVRHFRVRATVSGPGAAGVSVTERSSGNNGLYNAQLFDNDGTTPTGPRTLRFFAVGDSVAEGRDAIFDIVLSRPVTGHLIFPYTITPAATGGTGITAADFGGTNPLTGVFTLTGDGGGVRQNDKFRINIASPGGGDSEDAETFTVTLDPPFGVSARPDGFVFLQRSASKTILADTTMDPGAVTFSVAASETQVDEGESVDITFSLTQAYSGELYFRWGITGTGIIGDDFIGASGNRFQVFPAGQTSVTVPIYVLVDGNAESAETFTVAVHMAGTAINGQMRWPSRANPPLEVSSTAGSVTITIAQSTDTEPTAAAVATSVAIAGTPSAAPTENAEFTVSLTGLRLQPATVNYQIASAQTNGASIHFFDAAAGAAFPITGTLTVPPGTNPQATLSIPVLVPGAGATPGGFVVTLTSVQFAEAFTPTAVTGKTATGTVTAGTSVALARTNPASGDLSESSTTIAYSVTYTGPDLEADLVVAWATSAPAGDDPDGDGPATAASGDDFDTFDRTFPSGSVTFASGASGGASMAFNVELRDELEEEGAEYFSVTISVTSPSNFAGYLAPAKHTSVIAANDVPIPMTVSFVASGAPTVPVSGFSIAESTDDPADTADTRHGTTICVGITELPDGVTDIGATELTLNLVATAGSAGSGEFAVVANQPAILEQDFRFGCFGLDIINDSIPEDAETFTVSMRLNEFSRLAGAVTLGPDATVTITDADPIVIALESAAYSVAEGGSVSVSAVITTPPATVPIDIDDWSAVIRLATSVESGDTAVQGDFTAAMQDFTFSNVARRHMLSIAGVDDSALESAETFTVTLSENPDTTRVTTAAATAAVTIVDDDNRAGVSQAASVSEGDSGISWELDTTADLAEGAVVTYQLETNTAAAAEHRATAADLAPPSGAATGSGAFPIVLSYTVGAGINTSSGVTVNTGYGVRDDALNEGTESFRITILSADGATPGISNTVAIDADSADATVIDSITLSTPATPREGDTVFFTVQLSGGVPTADVSVAWTRSGDAEDADFTAASDTSPLTIPAGQMWGRIQLVLAEDADTSDATATDGFTVTLSAPASNNQLGGGDGVSLTATTADQSASVTSISAAPTGGEATEGFYVTGGPLAEPTGARTTAASGTYPQLFIHYFNSAGTALSADTTVSVSIVAAGGANNPIEHNAANGSDSTPPATEGDIWRFRPGSDSGTAFVPAAGTGQGFPTDAQLRGSTAVQNGDGEAVTFQLADTIASCGSATSRAGCDDSNAQVAAFVVAPNPDGLNEGDERFWVYLSADRGRVGQPLLVTISDNADDALSVAIAPSADADGNAVAGGTAFAEGGRARFTVSISGATATQDVVVDYAITGANITAGDFTGLAALDGHSVTIPVGRTSAEIVLTLAEDQVLELAESFTVTLSNPRTAGAISVGAATASLGIAADPAGEAALTVTAHADRNDVGNTVDINLFRARLHRAADAGTAMTFGQNVRLTVTHGGTACQGTLGNNCGDAIPDYTRRNAGGVTWGSGYVQLDAGGGDYNLPATLRGDQFNEGDETVIITVTAVTAVAAGATEYTALTGLAALPAGGLGAIFTIANDDALTVTLVPSAGADAIAEGGSASLRIELRGGGPHSGTPMTIAWAVRPTASATDTDATPADFTASAGGTTGLNALPSGSFTNAVLGRLDSRYNGVFTGGDSPSLRVVDVHITAEDLPDGDKNFDIVVTITGAGSGDVSFAGPHADGRAHFGIDPGRDQQLAFTLSGPTVNGAAATSVDEDAAAAADRTVTYTVTYSAHADIAAASALTGAAALTLTLGGNAQSADFVAAGAQTVNFAIGDASGTAKTATFVIANDNRSEIAETFTVTLGGLAEDEGIANAYINNAADAHIATTEIAASDAVTWTLQPLNASAAEPATPSDPAMRPATSAFYFRLTPSPALSGVTLGNDNAERVSVSFAIQSPAGAATLFVDADSDGNHDTTGETPDYRAGTLVYNDANSNALTTGDIVDGVVSDPVEACADAICIEVQVLSDDLNEAAESINLRVTSLSALQSNFAPLNTDPAHASRNAAISIAANDALTVAIGNAAAVNEGATAFFPLTITGGTTSAPLQLRFTVTGAGITATDFQTPTVSGSPLAGVYTYRTEVSPRLRITPARDNEMEDAETFTVTLTGATSPGGGTVTLAGASGGAERMATATIRASALDVRRLLAASDTSTGVVEGVSTCFNVRIEALNAGDTDFGFTEDTEVGWAVAHGDGNANTADTVDADFVNAGDRSGSVTFEAGETGDQNVCIDIRHDGLNEANEYFRITVSLDDEVGDGGTEISDSPPVIYAIDPEGDGITVTLSAPAGPLVENSATNVRGTFTVALSGGVRTGDVMVPLTFTGLNDADFNIGTPTGISDSATGLTVIFPGPGEGVTVSATDSMNIVLDFLDDEVNEADKTVRMASVPGVRTVGHIAYPLSDPDNVLSPIVDFAEVTLQDDDDLTFTVTPASGQSVNEGSTHTITLTPSGAMMVAAAVTLDWTATVTQSTTAGDDPSTAERPDLAFVGAATPPGTVTAGVLSGRRVVWSADTELAAMMVQIRPVSDAFKESAESVAVTFTRTVGAGGGMVTAPANHQFTIAESEAAARTIAAVATTTSVAEGEEITFTIAVTGAKVTEAGLNIPWAITPTTAVTAGAQGTSGTWNVQVSTAVGDRDDVSFTITVTATDDTASEADETVTLTLTDPCAGMVATCALGGRPTTGDFAVPPGAAATLTATATATATITESDRPVTVAIAPPAGDLTEGTAANFTVSFAESVTTTGAVTVTYSISFPTRTNAVNPAEETDFSATTGTVTISAGMNSVNLSLTAVDDAIFEPNETFTVTLTDASGGGAIAAPVLAPTTPAMDGDPVRAAGAEIAESDPVTVSINNPGGNVREGASAEFTVSIALTADTTMAATTEAPLCVTFSTAVSQQTTANGVGNPDIAVDNCDDIAQTITPATGATTTGGVLIPADAGRATLAVATRFDGLDEGATAEALAVTITAVAVDDSGNYTYPAHVIAGSPNNAGTVNIQNVNSARSISVAGPGTVGEDADIAFTVTIDGEPVTAQFTLAWTLGTDSDNNTDDAELTGANRDINSVSSGQLTVPVSASRRQELAIEILVVDDTMAEDDEVLTLTLTDPCASTPDADCATGGRPAAFTAAPGVTVDTPTAAATIGASDQTVTLQIAAPADALEEALRTTQTAASGAFTVSFAESVTTTADIQVQWRLKFPTAVAGGDSTRIVPAADNDFAAATRTGTATIPAGSSSVDITVTTAADLIQEPVETFLVELHGTPAGGGPIVGSGLGLHATEFEDTATIARSDDGGSGGDMSVDMISTPGPGVARDVDEGADVRFSVRLFHDTGQPGGANDIRIAGDVVPTSSVPICVTYTVRITTQQGGSTADNTAGNLDIGGVTDCAGAAVTYTDAADGMTIATGGVSIPAGSRTQDFTVTARFDNLDEGGTREAMVVQLTGASVPANSGVTAPTIPGSANQNGFRTANIRNINSARALSITGPDAAVDEGRNMEFTVTVTGRAIETAFNVSWNITAGAADISGSSGGVLSFSATSETSQTSQTITLAVADDTTSEAAETVTVTLTDPCPDSGVCGVGGRTGITNDATPALQLTGGTASGSIAESDRPVTVSIAAPPGDLTEGTASNFRLRFPETVTTTAAITVNWRIDFPTASTTVNPAVPADFAQAGRSGSIDIPVGQATVNLPITAADDAVFEADEDFTVTLTGVSGGGAIAAPVLAASPMASAKIDASDPVTVSIARAAGQGATVVEGGTARFTVSLTLTTGGATATAGAPICVAFGTAVDQTGTANNAGQGADVTVTGCDDMPVTVTVATGSATGGARIPAGASSAPLNIGARYDGYNEGATDSETLVVTLSSAADGDANFTYPAVTVASHPNNRADVEITNVNAARSVTVAGPGTVGEDAGSFNFTVTVTGQAVTQAFDIPWTITAGSATVTGAGADISSRTSGSLRVPVSAETSQTLAISVTVVDDSTAENDETLMLALSDICADAAAATDCNFGGRPATGEFDSAPAVVVSTTAATATIGQSDQTVTLQIAAPGGDLTEGTAANFTVSFTESVTTTEAITVSWTNNPGVTNTADTAAAADFTAAGLTGEATIPAGMSSVTVPITARADNHSEGPETFTVALSSPAGGGAIVGSGLTVSATAGSAQATIAASDPVQVSIARRSGQTGDVIEGSYAEFTVSLALVSDATVAATAANPICVTFRTEVNNQQTPANDASSGPDLEVRDCAGMTVTVAVANSQTTAGGALIPAGQSEAPLRVLVRYDDIDEGATDDERIAVLITSAAFSPALTGATAPVIDGNNQQRALEIQNTNALRTVAASTPMLTVMEDHTEYLFQITMAGNPPVSPVTVAWAVTDAENNPAVTASTGGRAVRSHGGAHGPADFTGPASGTVTFGVGDMAAKDVIVRARNDAYNEGAETLTVTLTDPCAGQAAPCEVGGRTATDPQAAPALAVSQATSTVQLAASDPIALSITAGPAAIVAGDAAVYTLHFGCANGETGDTCTEVIPTTDLTVPLTVTIGGTAETVAARTVPQGSRTFTLTAAEINMGGRNHGERLSVTLGTPTGLPTGATADPSVTTATETAVMGWTVALSADRKSAPEGSTFAFIVTLRGNPDQFGNGGITVPWTIAGTNINADDFVGGAFAGGNFVFNASSPPTMTESVVTARNDDDNLDSDTEMFTFTLGTITGGDAARAEIIGANFVTATIDPPVDEDVAALNRVIMPEVARAIADAQMNAVSARLRGAFDGGGDGGDGYGIARAPRAPLAQLGGQSTLAGVAAAQMQAHADGDVDWKRLAGASKFEMPLGAGHGGRGGGLAAGTFWGGGEFRGIGGKSGDTDWSGDLFSAHLGFDARLNRGLLSGLLLSYSEADIDDYTRVDTTRTARPTVAGEWLLEMTNLSPYLGWRGDNGVEVWALASYGSGDLTIDERGGQRQSDVTLHTFGAGLSGEILRVAGREVRARAEAFAAAAEIDDSKTTGGEELGVIPGDDMRARRVRLLLDLRRARQLASGATLDTGGEFGARYDTGDGRTGGGLELGGGVQYRDAAAGVTLEGRTRGLLAHSADYDDWGVSGAVKLAAGADGQGLSLAVSPAYGNTGGGAHGLWDGGLLAAAGDGDGDAGDDDALDLSARMDIRAAYGMRAFTATGLLTPFSGMSFADDLQRYQLGIEWQHRALRLKLAGERLDAEDTTHGVLFKGEMQF